MLYEVKKPSLAISHVNVKLVSDISEIVSEMSDTNSTLTLLIAQEDFIVYCHHESFKSYICMKIHCKHSYIFLISIIYKSEVTDMAVL
jgi:hypothetical protein